MLVGRQDAWALMGIGAGLAAANPMLAGNLAAAAPGLILPGLGAAWLSYKGARKWLDWG